MPVPAAITDLSTTPASNSPPGAETPTLGDDYLRTAFAFIKQVYDQLNAALVNLTTTGNTVLGNASTDTLDVGAGGIIKDASGNTGIGGASAGAKLEVTSAVDPYFSVRSSGANPVQAYVQASSTGSLAAFGTLNAYPVVFYTNSIDRGRFDENGAFLVGTASAASQNPGILIAPSGQINIGNTAQASGWAFLQFIRSAAGIGSITQSGTTAVLYNTTSDERLKEAIVDAPDAGSTIDAIKVRSFTWKTAPDERVTHGFIAQELVTIAPQAVKVGDDGAEVGDAWAVDPSKLVPLLVKELQDCRVRLAALEKG